MMPSRRPDTHADHALMLMLLVMALSYSTQHVFCPEVSQLGMSASLTCTGTNSSKVHTYLTPSGNTAAACDLARGKCIPLGNFTASVINSTSSVMTINGVRQSHGGDWTCHGDGNGSSCRMTISKFPTSSIVSVQGNSNQADEELTVDTTSFYCSEELQIQLLIEKGPLSSPHRQTTEDITDGSSVNKTGTDIMLLFTCASQTQKLPSEGVQEHGPVSEVPPDYFQLSSFVLGLGSMSLINILCLVLWCICKDGCTSGGHANADNQSDGPDQQVPAPPMGSEPGDDAIVPCQIGYTSLRRGNDCSDNTYDLIQDYE